MQGVHVGGSDGDPPTENAAVCVLHRLLRSLVFLMLLEAALVQMTCEPLAPKVDHLYVLQALPPCPRKLVLDATILRADFCELEQRSAQAENTSSLGVGQLQGSSFLGANLRKPGLQRQTV